MTAVFALIHADVLFIAGDTRRGSAYSLTVEKVHSWGDEVLLGQAGNGQHQSELIAQLKLGRCLPTQLSEADLFGLYTARRPAHVAAVQAPARPNGSLLVAALASGAQGAKLFEYDFATGGRIQLNRPVAAIGSDAVALTRIAALHSKALGTLSPFALDDWAQRCVADAIAQYPADIGWPCDMIISRPVTSGGRLIVQRRIDHASSVGLPEFLI